MAQSADSRTEVEVTRVQLLCGWNQRVTNMGMIATRSVSEEESHLDAGLPTLPRSRFGLGFHAATVARRPTLSPQRLAERQHLLREVCVA